MFALQVPNDFEPRTIDFARQVLDDIPECAAADYLLRWVTGVPLLVVAFHLKETRDQPACAVRLVTVSRSNPLTDGVLLEGDRLKGHIRRSIENYLHRHGIRIPDQFVN